MARNSLSTRHTASILKNHVRISLARNFSPDPGRGSSPGQGAFCIPDQGEILLPLTRTGSSCRTVLSAGSGGLTRAIFDKKGSIVEYQSVGQDITEQKRAEDALALACQKMNLLSSITRHDILNRLTVLSGYLALSEEFASDEKLLDFIKKEATATERINQQITFTKHYQDIGIQAPQWQNVHDTIADCCNICWT
ncbi:MAG: hypothetical protein MZV70_14015 [Desulfobacterales bacterium]|nr:hypothetical protein [Desulfobacterales bacterium]